jgi:hypothetical protein
MTTAMQFRCVNASKADMDTVRANHRVAINYALDGAWDIHHFLCSFKTFSASLPTAITANSLVSLIGSAVRPGYLS